MSLAASGGLGAGGGLGGGLSMAGMAHGGPSAMATHQHMQPPPGTTSSTIPGMAPPPSAAALGADLLDKNQGSLDKRNIRNVASMPIIAIDLYGEKIEVASFPSTEEDDNKTAATEELGLLCKSLGQLGSGDVVLKRDNDASHRAVRRVLTKSKGYKSLFQDAMTTTDDKDAAVVIQSPFLLLGSRNCDQLRPVVKAKYNVSTDDNTAVIAPSSTTDDDGSGVTIRNGTLDGISAPQGDDFDRVNLQVNLHSSKKSLTLLPEDAVGILLSKAKSYYESKNLVVVEEDEEEFLEYPPAIAVPAWACRDNTVESLLDACNSNSACVYNRSVAALAGALLPHEVNDPKIKNKKQIVMHNLIQTLIKRFQDEDKRKQDMANKGEETARSGEVYMPLVVLAGMTPHGIELTAIQIGNVTSPSTVDEMHCIFGDFKVLSNVSYQLDTAADANATKKAIHKALVQLSEVVDDIYPELEEDGGIVTMLTYGSIASQLTMKEALTVSIQHINNDEPDAVWNDKITFTSSRQEVVALGTAVLAASSHARIRTNTNDKQPKPRPGLIVQNVAPNAVGVSLCLADPEKKQKAQWTLPKVIFEYDRNVPAGPHQIELCASECVALKIDPTIWNDTEKLVEEGNKWNTGKHIGEREAVARSLKVKIVQQQERGGKWIQVGSVIQPLTITSSQKEGDDGNDEDRIAIESAVLEFSLSPTGIITSTLTSDGHSIVQATKNARSNTLMYYLKWIVAISFFGGFLVKSYVEDKIFERDVNRLLTYYKNVAPNTIADGDINNSRYLVWKYKGKKR
mmetsp:Transcript_20190/g.19436  ORF Transcript_20190/g.19436 Transcript_20190/m.19436 type:complete len:796 (-) Transcript_20190:448-2835(-)